MKKSQKAGEIKAFNLLSLLKLCVLKFIHMIKTRTLELRQTRRLVVSKHLGILCLQ
jgi:hypothetical protein